jgi:hypothetical protein
MPTWIHDRFGRRGGIGGEGITNTLEAGGWSSREDLLAREAIQNSVDATDHKGGHHKPMLRFRKRVLAGADKSKFLERLCMDDLGQREPFADASTDTVFRHAQNPGHPLELLYIEDFGTVGLGGGLEDPVKGHFYRLLFLVGDGGKAYGEEQTGGSYGFGKAVYGRNSNIGTIVVHSAFKPTTETNGTGSRLLGCCFCRSYEHEGQRYTGRAWFGEPSFANDNDPDPLVDAAADAFADSLGFSSRVGGKLGTSMLVVGSDERGDSLSMDRLRSAVETWWWPRILSDELDVEFWDGDQKLPPPQPRGAHRPDLKPYIECWFGLEAPSPEIKVFGNFQKIAPKLEVGRVALRALDEEEVASFPERDEDRVVEASKSPGPIKVALVRSTKMVIAYWPFGMSNKPPMVGVFRADSSIDLHLKLSEPAAHDRWDPTSRRLTIEHGEKAVTAVLARVKQRVREFQNSLQPSKPKPKEKLGWLDKMLGQMLRHQAKSPPKNVDGEKGPVSAHFIKLAAVPEGESLRLQATIELRLKERVEQESATVALRPVIFVVEGEDSSKGETLEMVLSDADGSVLKSGTAIDFTVAVSKDEVVTLCITSEAYSPDWTVDLRLELDPVEG